MSLSHEARELELYMENDYELYKQREPFLANMRKKMKKGTYRSDLGVKLWMYYVERGARKYIKEYGGTLKMFPPAVRREVAARFCKEAEDVLKGGG